MNSENVFCVQSLSLQALELMLFKEALIKPSIFVFFKMTSVIILITLFRDDPCDSSG